MFPAKRHGQLTNGRRMRKVMLFGYTLLLLSVATQGIAQAPQPGPEVKKLAALVGTWRYQGDAMASPLGPAAKVSGTQTGRMVMGGFALEWRGSEKGAFGGVQWGEMDVYDASSRSYPSLGYQNDGTTWSGSYVVGGNTWKFTGTITSKGVNYKMREETTLSADGKTGTWKNEISTDGTTWAPWIQGTLTKSK
jgi:hypothetical protein